MAIAFTIFNILINGYFMAGPNQDGLYWMSKLRYISALDWCWQGCMMAEFSGRIFPCPNEGPLPVEVLGLFPELLPNTSGLSLVKTGLLSTSGRDTCVADGDALLEFYGISTPVGVVVGYLVAYLVAIHVFTYAALLYVTRRAA
ncbi:hypothetical protein FOA52_002742 [Chlamydomonas sp. UWO 241]|nr:hypothetical protein FOA52_002742 [Chlamydomonas sp. UWO 241]